MTAAFSERQSAKIYTGLWGVLVNYFRVPKDSPEIPGAGAGATIKDAQQFKPAMGFLKYLKFWFWIVLLITDIIFAGLWIATFFIEWWLGLILTPIALAIIIVPDIIAFIAIHLRYDTTWYVMTDRAMRIRRGIWLIDERTITYENIQNVKVTQGPLQRHFNIANVIVETAGAGAAAGKHQTTVGNQGRIEGVANAQEIRDRILAKLRDSQSAGLGDEELSHRRVATVSHSFSPAHLGVLRRIHEELTALNRRSA